MNLIQGIKSHFKLNGLLGTLSDRYLHSLLVKLTTIDNAFPNCTKIRPISPGKFPTPEVEQMLFFPRAESLKKSTYSLPDIYSTTLDNVLYSPTYNVILNQSRQVILDSVNTGKSAKRFSVSELYRKKIKKLKGVYSIFRSTDNSYYHTLIENVSRLYLLNHKDYREIPEIQLLLSSKSTKIEEYYLDQMLQDNVTIKVVEENYIYSLEKLIFCTFLNRRFCGYLPLEYLEYFGAKILPQRSRDKNNRIFISRSTDLKKILEKTKGIGRCEQDKIGKGRYLLNEEELFQSLKKYGFKKHVLEELSIPEQIELFYDADFIVGAHGAGLSNMIFSDRVKILELFPTQFCVPHYYYLAKSLGHTYRYWCGQEDEIHSNFTVNVAEVISRLGDL